MGMNSRSEPKTNIGFMLSSRCIAGGLCRFRQYEKTEKILTEKRDILDKVAELLLEKETITGEEFEACFDMKGEN